MKDKKGFTLTELLAVIVLIGVILAIAVPSYQSYVTRTRKEVLESYKANIIDAANARSRNMSQATALGARMCQGTFFFIKKRRCMDEHYISACINAANWENA